MKRNILNVIIDTASLLVLLGLAATGLVTRFILPAGSSGRRQGGWELWGWGRHDWGDLHFWLAAALVGLLLLHLALHGDWIRSMSLRIANRTRGEHPGRVRRMAWSLAIPVMTLVVLGAFWWAASDQVTSLQQQAGFSQASPVEFASHGQNGWGRESRGGGEAGITRGERQACENRPEAAQAPGHRGRGLGRCRSL